ncbi:MAG: UDP-2,3-diacylglucosamine diphosphatase [Desulfuromonas sp.]|nr:MAG: UDP-2,3-diacylglucosamine diphosphatase [Desulfuromonas sp.]
MRALFIADAHLRHPDDANYQALMAFLNNQAGQLDLLVLLGDIFEFWAGDREVVHPSYRPLLATLRHLTENDTQLVYVEGNHDFDLGRQFTEKLGCQVLADGGIIEFDGLNLYLAHGDLANPEDRGYRLLRRLLRTPLTRTLVRHLPIDWVMTIALRSSRESRSQHPESRRRWPAREILPPYATQKLASGCHAVITGHFHEPFHQQLEGGALYALGDWITQYSYLIYENGRFEFGSHITS